MDLIRVIYLFNPTDGYIVVVYGGSDIPMDEHMPRQM